MRYRHNPDLDIQGAHERYRELLQERNNLERDIDTLAVVRGTEAKVSERYSQLRRLEQQIQEQQAHVMDLLAAREAAQLKQNPMFAMANPVFALANPNPSRSTPMAAAKDFFRMTRDQLVKSSAPGAKAELRRRGRDAQGRRLGAAPKKKSAATKSRKSKGKARRSAKKK